MGRATKFITGGFLLFGGIVALFILGLRSCLAKYDTRSAVPPVAYVEKNGKAVLFSIIQYTRTTSYSQKGGMTQRSVSDEYYVQANDVVTGKKIAVKEVEIPSRPKYYPLEVLGVSGSNVWVFINELMAYDAFTLEKIADIKSIEEKNIVLKGRLPKENSYYKFIDSSKEIHVTATDGSIWKISTKTLIATPAEEEVKSLTHSWDQLQTKIADLQKMNVHFSQIKLNQDTSHGRWTGIYTPEEFRTLNQRVEINVLHGQDQRRQLMSGTYDSSGNWQKFIIKKDDVKTLNQAGYFLDGGFLADKMTAAPIHLKDPQSFLIVYKEQIGNDGKLLISRVTVDGRVIWKFNTSLSQWSDWQVHGNYLYVFGNNRREIPSSHSNLLHIINLENGAVKGYDYFNDKEIE